MDLRKLEIFACVARSGSISAAARALPMAQPAVSIAVQKLEQELGCELFERIGRSIRLTAEGQSLLVDASAILEQVADLQQSANKLQTLQAGELNIACPSMLGTYFLPSLLGEFLAEYPGINANVTQAGTRRVEEMLLRDEIEVGVITLRGAQERPDLVLQELLTEQVMICVSRKHPWATRRFIRAPALQGQAMAVYEEGYFIREQLDRACAENEVTPDYRMQTNFLPLIIEMVKSSSVVTVGLQMMARNEPDLVGIPLQPRIPLHLAVACKRGRRISRANQAFVDWLAEDV